MHELKKNASCNRETGKIESPFLIGVSQSVIYKPDETYAAHNLCAWSTEMTCRCGKKLFQILNDFTGCFFKQKTPRDIKGMPDQQPYLF